MNHEIQIYGEIFEVFTATSAAQIKQLCQQMQILIDSGEIEVVDLSSADEASDSKSDLESDSDTESEINEEEGNSGQVIDLKPDNSEA